MRFSSAVRNSAFVLAFAALFAGCAGGTQVSPPAGGSNARLARPAKGSDSVIYAFTAGANDGNGPYGSPLLDVIGNLYGTSSSSPLGGPGVVWEISGSKEKALYRFPRNGTLGARPEAGLIAGSGGGFYGTTTAGGKGSCSVGGLKGCGVVFELAPSGGGYKASLLHDFGVGQKNDGSDPSDALLQSGSELYGTTTYGGSGSCAENGYTGCGTVFKVGTNGSGYSVLYSFKGGKDGEFPMTSLIDIKGALYGVTDNGGSTNNCPAGCGIVFKLTAGKGGGYTETNLYTFKGGKDGGIPSRGRGLYLASNGALVGTTQVGGSGPCALGFLGGCGTVFMLTPKGGGYTESVVYNFQGGSDGQAPNEELSADSSGNLYGAAFEAGGSTVCLVGCGAVFELTPSGSSYTESVVFSFQGGKDGALPYGGVTVNQMANELYGTTYLGGGSTKCGSLGCGTVFTSKV